MDAHELIDGMHRMIDAYEGMTTVVENLAARLDKLTERVDGIEKAHKPIEYCTCDPEKRSIRQGLFAWDMRCSVCGKPINPAELYATNDAKPAPD